MDLNILDFDFNTPSAVLATGSGSSWLSMILTAEISADRPRGRGIVTKYIHSYLDPPRSHLPRLRLPGTDPTPEEILPAFKKGSLSVVEKLHGLLNNSTCKLGITSYREYHITNDEVKLDLSIFGERVDFTQDMRRLNKYKDSFLLVLDGFSELFPGGIDSEDLREFVDSLKAWNISLLLVSKDPALLADKHSIFDHVITVKETTSPDYETMVLAVSMPGREDFAITPTGRLETGKYFFSWRIQEIEKVS